MRFEFQAKDLSGKTIKGTIEAINEEQALDVLSRRNLVVLYLKEKPKTFSPKSFSWASFFKRKISSRDKAIFSRQLAVTVSAGLPLVQALETLAGQTGNKYFDKIVGEIADNIRGGSRFSTSLARYPEIFDDFYINMVKAGEVSGRLDSTLVYLADEEEKNYDLQRKLRGAMIYPVFVLSMVVIILILMLTFVIPQITGLILESGGEIPLPTRMVIGLSNFIKYQWPFLLLFVGILGFFYFLLTRTKKGRVIWDKLLLRIPIFGRLFKLIALVRLTASLSTLIVGGIPLPEALQITADVVGNHSYRQIVLEAMEDVKSGRSIASSFLTSPLIPRILSNILIIGEQTGKLDEVLKKMADFYSGELESMLSQLVSLLEPVIIVFLGLVVGGIVLSIFLPIYQLASIQF